MIDKIELALEYYQTKEDQILNVVNAKNTLTADKIIEYGEELNEISHKITALQVAMEN